jgi:hypothetical protein
MGRHDYKSLIQLWVIASIAMALCLYANPEGHCLFGNAKSHHGYKIKKLG